VADEYEQTHRACVAVWMERTGAARERDRLPGVLEAGFTALWQRAFLTLGEVTLMAIVDRVIHSAAERYRFLGALRVDATGLDCAALPAAARTAPDGALEEGVRFVLVEFLTVLGNLTAEILTPALHAALAQVTGEARSAGDEQARGDPQTREPSGEDVRS
jgi:hypothetical protein